MALTTNSQSNAFGFYNRANGVIVTDAGAAIPVVLQLGFLPRYFRIINLTDRIADEWYEGMASPSSLRTAAAGTQTAETTNGIAVSTANNTVSLTAASVPASKSLYWVAEG